MGTEHRRILVTAFGDPGHAFPAISLARALAERGHTVAVESWERWREAVEGIGIRFEAAEEYTVFPPPPPGGASASEAARGLEPLFEDFRPDAVVTDVLTLAPALAAEVARVPWASLIPHIFPVHQSGMPFFATGMQPPRTPLGRWVWTRSEPALENGLRRGREELNEQRALLGLAPVHRFHGGISDELVLVGTFPQLEYPRPWRQEVKVVGPMAFELPYPDVELPPGDEPLVLVTASTAHDPEKRLIRVSLEALADEPVRVLATTNGPAEADFDVPANALLVDWLSFSQVMPESAVVVSHGGHGTVARSLAAGVPVLTCPAAGDMAETASRISWAGVGRSVPWRLAHPRPMRWVLRELLGDPSYRRRAQRLGAWAQRNDGARRGAELVERFASR